jgi:hypothetical protein
MSHPAISDGTVGQGGPGLSGWEVPVHPGRHRHVRPPLQRRRPLGDGTKDQQPDRWPGGADRWKWPSPRPTAQPLWRRGSTVRTVVAIDPLGGTDRVDFPVGGRVPRRAGEARRHRLYVSNEVGAVAV